MNIRGRTSFTRLDPPRPPPRKQKTERGRGRGREAARSRLRRMGQRLEVKGDGAHLCGLQARGDRMHEVRVGGAAALLLLEKLELEHEIVGRLAGENGIGRLVAA